MNGLLIKDPYVTWILEGKKTWEIRGSSTKVRGRIALIKSKTGHVFGTCELVDVKGPLSLEDLRKNAAKLNWKPSEISASGYEKTYAWVLKDARPLETPVPYTHPSGAVIWVKLPAVVLKKLGV